MEREHAEQPLLGDDRGREHGANAVLGESVDVAEGGVVEHRSVEDVGHGDGAPQSGGEVDDRQQAGVAERRHALRIPLGGHHRRIVLLTEPDEAANRVEGDADLCEHRRQHLVDVPAGPELERDVRDQPLALERVCKGDRRARALERQAGLVDERLHPAKLVVVEDTRAANGAEDDADELLTGPNRHEDAALHLGDRVQPLVDDGGVLGVVDRERRSLADGGVDPRRLAVERDPLADKAGVILPALAGGDDHGRDPVGVDQRQVCEIERECPGELVEEHLRDVGGLGGIEQLL